MPNTASSQTLKTVDDLYALDRVALVNTWRETFATPTPKRLSSPFLRRFLAFELQARQSCGLPKKFASKLEAAAKNRTRPLAPALQPGARLLREWNGVTHIVDVTDDGFLWKGERRRSLSGIAKAITGAHWSGPRFFGLNGAVRS